MVYVCVCISWGSVLCKYRQSVIVVLSHVVWSLGQYFFPFLSAPMFAGETILDERSIYISFLQETGLINRKYNLQLRRFAECLQDQSFTVHFEPNCQAEIQRCGGVVSWKEACIRKSKNIIVICTPEYYKEDLKAIDGTKKYTRSKIGVDSQYLRQLAFGGGNCRIVPVVLDARKPSQNQFPMWVQPLVRYFWPSCERDLLLCLEDLPRYILPKADPKKRKVIKPIVIKCPDFG